MADEKEHSCPNCPDTSAFDKILETGSPLFHGWAKAAKEHAIGRSEEHTSELQSH